MYRLPLALAAALMMISCSSTTQSIRVPTIGVVARDLDRNEYIVLGTAEGNSCVEQSCLLGIFCTIKDESGSTIAGAEGGRSAVVAAASEQAMLKALKGHPDADAVFAPRKSQSIEIGSQIITTSIKACVRIFGKSVRIKTDDEMKNGVAPPAPTAPAAPPAVITPPAG